jgi:hypothetical protein
LQGYIFWVGILEYVMWILYLGLFVSHPRKMAIVCVFIYHVARATIGMAILRFIPKTHDVIENLKDYGDSTLEDIQTQMQNNYRSLIHSNEKVMKPLLVIYYIITVISLLGDLIVFCIVAANFTETDYEFRGYILMSIIICFICKY